MFNEGTSATRVVAENTAAGGNIGGRISARDADGHTLTYGISGTDASSFDINSGNGQLITMAALDYETKGSYAVVVSVSDGRGGSDRITVTIEVRDEDEAPQVAGSDSVSYGENGTDGVAAYSATDPEGAIVGWSLSGADAGEFTISDEGELSFGASPDFEAPGDADGDNAYEVRVEAADGTGNTGALDVTVTVTNVDEAGAVNLGSTQPQVGNALTATLTDPDGSISGVTWAWERSTDQNTWTAISGATLESYTPVAGDVDSYLRATSSYSDGHGTGKGAQAASENPVEALPQPGVTPVPGAALVKSTEETVIMSSDGTATLTFPSGARSDSFQVRMDTSAGGCTANNPPEGVVPACVRVELFNASGEREENTVLDEAATLEIRLRAEKVGELGGETALNQANEEGRVKLLTRNTSGDLWTEVPFELSFEDDGVAVFTASIREFSDFAIVLTPIPEAVPPTPEPTVAPTPEATPEATPTAGPTPEPTVAPTPEATPEATPTAGPTPEPTVAPTPEATATLAPTSEPTQTPAGTPRAGRTTTATMVPTAAATPISPSPTAAPESTPTETPVTPADDGGVDVGLIMLIVLLVAAAVGGGALIVMRRRSGS